MYVRSGLQADELRNVGGDDFRLKYRCIGFDITDLAGGDFILCNFAGLAGTGINQRLRAILELAGAAGGNHNVAKIAIELLLNTHGVSLQKMPWPTHTGAASALTTPKAWSTGLIRASEFRWRHFSALAISSSSSRVDGPWFRLMRSATTMAAISPTARSRISLTRI